VISQNQSQQYNNNISTNKHKKQTFTKKIIAFQERKKFIAKKNATLLQMKKSE